MAIKYMCRFKDWLQSLSFRSGVICIVICLMCYAISFAQMILPLSVGTKGVLWAVFYGLAKAMQYTGIAILGKAGVARLRGMFKRTAD